MALYKSYEKGEQLGSIRVFGVYKGKGKLTLEYVAVTDLCKFNETKKKFEDKRKAEQYMTDLGYKEYESSS